MIKSCSICSKQFLTSSHAAKRCHGCRVSAQPHVTRQPKPVTPTGATKLCQACGRVFRAQAPRVRRCKPCIASSKPLGRPRAVPSENRSRAMKAYHQVKRDLAAQERAE